MVALNWRSELTGDEAAQVRALLAAATEADGTPPVSDAGLLRLRPAADPGPAPAGATWHLLAGGLTDRRTRAHGSPDTASPNLVGYAQVHDGVAELAVDPAERGRGVGGLLVGALVERARPLRIWAHGAHPAALRLAERHGFVRDRVLLKLRRTLDGELPEPAFPGGVTVRSFVVGRDEAAFVEVNNRAFARHPEQGGWDVEQVRLREAEPWFDADGFLLAVEDAGDAERILGFHWTKVHDAELGEVYVLGVDPAAHGRGLGGALTLAGLHALRDRGLSTVMLYVEADNEAALRTYRKLGFEDWSADLSFRLS